jgi:SAM-dependent methyltransferase
MNSDLSMNVGPLAAALLADRGLGLGSFPLEIDPRDEMLSFLLDANEGDLDRARFIYYLSGMAAADSLRQLLLWRFGSWDRIGRVLDYASGYGRVVRFLLRDLPPERIWVADLYPEAVAFQRQRFGVHGLASAVRPEDFAKEDDDEGRFDAILVTSLFTHLPEERFVGWLRRLLERLAPGGMLLFSVHDEAVLTPGQEMPAGGIRFEAWSESASLDPEDYGSTWVTESFVRSALARALPGASLAVHRLPRALIHFQDLYAVVPRAPGETADFSTLVFRGEPQVHVETCAFPQPGRLEVAGWAAARGAGRIREVQLRLDGEILAAAPVDGNRPDVAAHFGDADLRPGWRLAVPLPPGTSWSRSLLTLHAVDDRGAAQLVDAGSIEWALLSAARREALRLGRDLFQLREDFRILEGTSRSRIEWLEAVLREMKESRFWKMRTAWFRLKRTLGLTGEI